MAGSIRTTRITLVVLIAAALALLPLPALASGLARGDAGDEVFELQQQLADRGLYRGPIDGRYGPMTAQAVMAFHKHLGLERSFEWRTIDWRYLEVFDQVPVPNGNTIVADLDRQVMYLWLGGSPTIVPISTGNGEPYETQRGGIARARTPEGSFRLTWFYDGLRESFLGQLWKPWYFYGGYAIHGSGSVPAGPASHGCIRVPNWEADWLAGRLALGMDIAVTRTGGARPPELPKITAEEVRRLYGIRVPTVDGSHLEVGARSMV